MAEHHPNEVGLNESLNKAQRDYIINSLNDDTDENVRGMLYCACLLGNIEIIDLLLKNAYYNCYDISGAIEIVCSCGNETVLKKLLNYVSISDYILDVDDFTNWIYCCATNPDVRVYDAIITDSIKFIDGSKIGKEIEEYLKNTILTVYKYITKHPDKIRGTINMDVMNKMATLK